MLPSAVFGTRQRNSTLLGVQVYYSGVCRQRWVVVEIDPTPGSAPELAPSRPRGLDRQGWIEALAGLVIALIALLTSYDHISLPAGALQLPQQWGVWFIAASMALVFVVAEGFCEAVAQLATGSRLRAAQDAARAADETARERDRAAEERIRAAEERIRSDRERNRAAEERERAARRARRQDRCALAQFEFQLHPNTTTRQRLADLISLLREYGEFA